jgi:hypothetical protein
VALVEPTERSMLEKHHNKLKRSHKDELYKQENIPITLSHWTDNEIMVLFVVIAWVGRDSSTTAANVFNSISEYYPCLKLRRQTKNKIECKLTHMDKTCCIYHRHEIIDEDKNKNKSK